MENRICFICNEYPPHLHGGIGSMTRDLAEGLVTRGFAVTVMGVMPSSDSLRGIEARKELNGVDTVLIPGSPRFLPVQARILLDRWKLHVYVQREHHAHGFRLIECPDYEGWLPFGGPSGVPLVCRLHGSVAYFDAEIGRQRGSRIIYLLEGQLIRHADHIVSVSQYTGEKTLARFKYNTSRFRVINNAVDTDLFSPGPDAHAARQEVVFVGSLVQRKGIEEFLEAMKLVLSAHPYAIAKVVGRVSDDYRRRLLEVIPVELRERIHFIGHVSRGGVIGILRSASVCVFPSWAEAFPIAPLEAMSVGRPIILSERTSGPEIVEPGVNGLLCDPSNPAEIANGICDLLDNSETAGRLGRNARARVLDRFEIRQWLDCNVAFYASVARTN